MANQDPDDDPASLFSELVHEMGAEYLFDSALPAPARGSA
jgi:hypothetical protein